MQKRIRKAKNVNPSGVVFLQRVDEGKKRLSRELRTNQTQAEEILWENVRRNAIAGCKFRRQQIILGFIVDFYCDKARLVVEIDGGIHDMPDQKEKDDLRRSVFAEKGISEIRFKNDEVIWNINSVVSKLKSEVIKKL